MKQIIYSNGIEKTMTDCCAFCQISRINNLTPKEDIVNVLDILEKEMHANTEVGVTTGRGQTAVFTVVSPGEDVLEKNLIEIGFEFKHTFPRRKGYNEISHPDYRGDLKLYIINL